MRRLHLRGRDNTLKRLVVHSGAANLGLLMRKLFGKGTPRGLARNTISHYLGCERFYSPLVCDRDAGQKIRRLDGSRQPGSDDYPRPENRLFHHVLLDERVYAIRGKWSILPGTKSHITPFRAQLLRSTSVAAAYDVTDLAIFIQGRHQLRTRLASRSVNALYGVFASARSNILKFGQQQHNGPQTPLGATAAFIQERGSLLAMCGPDDRYSQARNTLSS